MQMNIDSTFDCDAETMEQAEELALREALAVLGETAGKLRTKDRGSRSLRFRSGVSSRVH